VKNIRKECARLMFGPPIQFVAAREARAAREGKNDIREKWAIVVATLSAALRLTLEAIDAEK